jgi:multiple sugar transport system substrate-binding protein
LKKNNFLTLFTILIALFLFVGLADAETITIWGRENNTELVVKNFNTYMENQGRDIEAKFQLIPYEQQNQKLMASFAAGNPPDLVSLDIILHPYYNSIDAFTDLTDFVNSLPYRDALPQGMLNLGKEDGKLHGVPYTVDLSAFIWNKDLFEKEGLDPNDPPETWEELIEIGKKLTKDTDGDGTPDQYGLGMVGKSAGWHMFGFMPFVWSNGGNLVTAEGKSGINEPEAIEAIEFWTDLIHEHEIAPKTAGTWGYSDVYNAFITNKIGMMVSGNFNILTFKQDAPELNYGITYIPRPKDGHHSSFSGGNLIAIPEQSAHKEAAKEFLRYALSEEVQVDIWAKNGALPVRTDLFDNKYFDEEPIFKVFADVLAVSQAPKSTKYNELYDPMLTAMQRSMLGEIAPERAAEIAAEKMNEILSSN